MWGFPKKKTVVGFSIHGGPVKCFLSQRNSKKSSIDVGPVRGLIFF